MNISVACPSYKRPQDVKSFKYLPFLKVYVAPEEFEEYEKYNFRKAIIKCDPGVQGNVSRVRNFILDSEFKNGADVIVIVDDDLTGIYYWQEKKKIKIEKENFYAFIEKYTRMAQELEVFLWGVNLNQDKQLYREYGPFSTVSPIFGPFQCFLKGSDLRYDERLPLKEDYDMSLQHLNQYRKILRVNKFFYVCKQSEQKGGCANYRNVDNKKSQLKLLQKKWGSDIVSVDRSNRSHNLQKKKKVIDYNPIVRVPIKGV